ncbi:nitroreductase family protein [Fusibacter paucivorans]|uniref:Nitroreductase family protein n=1 Tax=Fusibacter paucivorans TaxID=76009 RepID=A0ABS5PKY6_9FIRM|nr:nitroreductase family protein [Fusibacter paucivorans]MBS7525532.1 nitroreductase family protein [Fusibacter paucivorans]
MNETIKIMKDHTSIRKFNGMPLTDAEIDAIIESAMRGATAGNMMLYSLIDVRSKENLSKLAVWCDNQPFIESAAFALIVVVDYQKWHRFYELNGLDRSLGYDGPTPTDLVLGMQDAMIAAQNAVIAAESMGIGTCYIGDILEHKETVSAHFGLPDYTIPATLIVFGRYEHKPVLRKRFDKSYVVFSERYETLSDESIKAMFSEHFTSDGSVEAFYKRKHSAPFYKEMVRSIRAYFEPFFKGE